MSGPDPSTLDIATPDRRVRVFVSSTLAELAPEREAVRAAILGLRLTPVMFEAGARPHPPRELYRAYLAQSDVFVGIYWQRYGWVAPGETVSGLEDEYRLSGDRPKLIYVKAPAPDREQALAALLGTIQDDDRASYKPFTDPAELGELLAEDLAVLLTERFTSRGASTPGLRPARLPVPLTAMVGRDTEREALAARFRDGVRLVTLTGPGGIGKTRLALDVAAALQGTLFEDVWWVDLSSIPDPSRVPGAVATALGLQTPGRRPVLDVLADQLSGHRALLVLDNVEHVRAAATDISRLLTDVPGLAVLTTSRTVLHLRGEQDWPLAPLALPAEDGGVHPDRIAESAAVQLFVDRATAARPGFRLTAENAAAVAEICRRLDGIPLALELAAARVRLLPPAVLVNRLTDRLDLPDDDVDVPERQRTLRSTLDWSYHLLGARDRVLLARLSVFAGGWTVEGAEMVGADRDRDASGPVDVLATLSSLIDNSLVTVDDGTSTGPRFRMLGVVRQYAAERLDEHGERDAVTDRFVTHVRSLVEEAGRGLRTTHRTWAARLDDELDNVRAAWGHAIAADDAETAYRICLPIAYYLWSRSLLPEALSFVEDMYALPSASRLDAVARGNLLWARAATNITIGHLEDVPETLDEARQIAQQVGDFELLIRVTTITSYVVDVDRLPPLRTTLEDGLAHFRRCGDLAGEAYALPALGQLMVRSGELDGVAAIYERMLWVAERMDNDHMQTVALHQLGFQSLLHGRPAQARGYFEKSLAANTDLIDQEGVSFCLDGLADVAYADGNAVAAARLYGAAERLRTLLGIGVWLVLQPRHDRGVAAVCSELGEARFEEERRTGMQLRPAEAVAYAREIAGPAGPDASSTA